MTNHRRQSLKWQPIPPRPYLAILLLSILAGAMLGWSLRQIRNERDSRQGPRVQLRELPASSPIPVKETERGIQFTF